MAKPHKSVGILCANNGLSDCATPDHCFANGCRKPNPPPDDSYKELMGDYGDSPVLRKSVEIVDGREKQDHYGPPKEFMERLAKAWSAYLSRKLREEITPLDCALMMANLKILRLAVDPKHDDSLADLGGYTHIAEKVR